MVQKTYHETPISVNAAAKKYGIPQRTLADWAHRGRLKVLAYPEKHGQKMLVDEASVVLAREAYIPHWRGEGRNLPLPFDQHYASPPGVEPAKPTPQLSTSDLAEEYHKYGEFKGFAPTTMIKHRQVLKVFAEKCPTLPLTPEPIINFINDLDVGPRTKKKYYEVIRQLYNYLQDFKSIPTPLKPRMVPRSERHPYFRVLEREEITKLFNAAENYQERMILETLYATAVRVGELVSLTSDNLFPDHIVVTGKTGTWEVPISPELYASLVMLGEGPLFKDRSGKPMTRDGVRQRVEKCMRQIGITGKKVGPHTLRHTSLTHLYEDSGDLPLVQEAAHHADMQTTMIYTHPRAVKQRAKLLKHDRLKALSAPGAATPDKDKEAKVAEIISGEEEE